MNAAASDSSKRARALVDARRSAWEAAWLPEQARAMKAALIAVMRGIENPTLGDLLAVCGDHAFVVDGAAGTLQVGELLGLGEVGPTILQLLYRLDIRDVEDPLHDARLSCSELLDCPLSDFADERLLEPAFQ